MNPQLQSTSLRRRGPSLSQSALKACELEKRKGDRFTDETPATELLKNLRNVRAYAQLSMTSGLEEIREERRS